MPILKIALPVNIKLENTTFAWFNMTSSINLARFRCTIWIQRQIILLVEQIQLQKMTSLYTSSSQAVRIRVFFGAMALGVDLKRAVVINPSFKSALGSRHGFHISERHLKRILSVRGHSGYRAYSDLIVLVEFSSKQVLTMTIKLAKNLPIRSFWNKITSDLVSDTEVITPFSVKHPDHCSVDHAVPCNSNRIGTQ